MIVLELENFFYFEFEISTMLVERIFGRFCTYFLVAMSQCNKCLNILNLKMRLQIVSI